jgi:ATP-dependent Clp protease ATP-binding subunit ClpC
MTDGQGKVVDFRNTILIMTSNLGTEYVNKSGPIGFLPSSASDEERESDTKINKALKDAFRPEFLNRIDEIIAFSALSIEEMEEIVDLQMKEIQGRLNEFGISAALTSAARTWLAKEGYDKAFGARPLKRALQKFVESPLSMQLLQGDFKDGGSILVDLDIEKNEIVFMEGEKIPKSKKKADAT